MNPEATFSVEGGAASHHGMVTGPGWWISLAAAFLGEGRLVAVREGSGAWHVSGPVTEGQKRDLETGLVEGAETGGAEPRQGREGHWVLDTRAYEEPGRPGHLGRLFVLATDPTPLSSAERAGLQYLVAQLGRIVPVRNEDERRASGRGPSGASFVPGLVHELRNFIFGISASLDAFEVRFRGQDGVAKYQAVIRKSLDRLGVFVDELLEYGDPGRRPWTEVDLHVILREACEHHRTKTGTEANLELIIQEELPRFRGDEQGLREAFIRLMDLGLCCGSISPPVLKVWQAAEQGGACIHGSLILSIELKELDLGRLFEPFYFRPAGLGRLALPVARRVFETHGGELQARPGVEGGLEIGFTLPVG